MPQNPALVGRIMKTDIFKAYAASQGLGKMQTIFLPTVPLPLPQGHKLKKIIQKQGVLIQTGQTPQQLLQIGIATLQGQKIKHHFPHTHRTFKGTPGNHPVNRNKSQGGKDLYTALAQSLLLQHGKLLAPPFLFQVLIAAAKEAAQIKGTDFFDKIGCGNQAIVIRHLPLESRIALFKLKEGTRMAPPDEGYRKGY